MSENNELLIDPAFEEMEEGDDFEMDEELNTLARNTLNFMQEQLAESKIVPEDQYLFLMLHAAEATVFNLLMEIAEKAHLDPLELAVKTKNNLIEAIESMGGGCCGGGEHHH